VITKTERGELRSLINQRFAEMEVKIGESFDDENKRWSDVSHLIHEAVMEANRVANDACRGLVGETWQETHLIRSAGMDWPPARWSRTRHGHSSAESRPSAN